MKLPLKVGVSDIVVAMLVATIIVLSMLPLVRAVSILPVLLVAYLLPCIVYRRMSFYNPVGQCALSLSFVMMTFFTTLNLWQSTVLLGSVDAPMLLHDAFSFHRLSQDIANDTLSEHSPILPYMGYPYFLSLWRVLGINDIAYPLVVNILVLLISLLLVGRCVVFVMGDNPYTTRMAAYAMMLTAIVPGVMSTATQLAKEPFVICALLLCLNAMYAIKQRHRVALYAVMLAVGLLVLSTCRPTYIYILLMYMPAIWLYKFVRRDIASVVVVLMAMSIALYAGVQYSWWGSSDYIGQYVESGAYSGFSCGESQKPMQQLLGEYKEYTLLGRFLILPVTVAVQFLIPFPFETAPAEFGMPLSSAYARMSYLWYIAAIPMILFYLLHWWRKGCDVRLSLMALVSAMAYCVPAFISGGVVSRYAFCFVPMLSVVGAYTLVHIHTYSKQYKRVAIPFTVAYVVLISIALYIGANPSVIL